MAQILSLVDTAVIDPKMLEEVRVLHTWLGSSIFYGFIERQRNSAATELARLNPTGYKDPNEFYQIAKDRQLALRFWTDLLALCEDFAKKLAEEN